MLVQRARPVATQHTLPELIGYGERLAGKHRGLVGYADPDEIALEIEAGRNRSAEAGLKSLDVSPGLYVITDGPRLVHVEHHQIAALGVFRHLAGGSLRLLVVVLAVDDGRIAVPRVILYPLPHVEHRTTRGVHQNASDGAKTLKIPDGDPERRHDHDIVRSHR